MGLSRNDFIEQAFVLEPEDLKHIDRLYSELPGEKKFIVETEDKYRRTYNSVDDLINLENPKSNQIKKIEIRLSSRDPYLTANISFEKDRINNIYTSFVADSENYTPIFDKIINRIEGVKPWYSKLSKTDFITYSLIAYFLLNVFAWILVALEVVQTSSGESSSQVEALARLLVFGIIGGLFFLGWLLNNFRNVVFPSGTFVIGQEAKRHKTLEKFRWSVVVGGALSLTISMILLIIS